MMSDNEDLLRTAAEQFLGKGEQEIEDTIIQVIELFSFRAYYLNS